MSNFFRKINFLFSKPFIFLISIYQKFLSPDHSFWRFRQKHPLCKFYPTCSEYSKESFENFGFARGFFLSTKRILKCLPWREYSVDLVPKK